jgi:glutathionylspermidine synthase
MSQAIQDYHDLLTPEVAEDSHAMLEDQLTRRGLIFGDRPLCTVLRPRLMTREQHQLMQKRVVLLMRTFGKAYQAALADATLREQFRLERWEEQLIGQDPGFRDPSPTSRLDAFVMDAAGTMALTEYNAETPAGAGFNDQLVQAFASLPVIRAFSRRYQVEPLLAQAGVVNVLLDTYREWSGQRTLPRVAIVDWPDVPTRLEFVLYQRYFHSLGIDCVIADPREMDYRGGRLIADGAPVDLIYKRVLITELVKECGLEHPVVRAVRDRAVCMVNPFRSKILHKKASLAVLSDERNARLFRPAELEAIRAHVPWTRIVEERRTVHDGEPVDLLPHIAEHRNQMVLKPNDDYGGAGIVLGWQVDAAEWQAAIRTALATPYIVQERVPIPSEPYPSFVDGQVQVFDRMLDTAPFVSYGDFMQGQLTRLSTAALLNVTAGGGSTVPTFLIEER